MRLSFCLTFIVLSILLVKAQNLDIQLLRVLYTPGNQPSDATFQFLTDSYPLVVAGTPVLMGATALLTNDKRLFSDALEVGTSVLINAGMVLAVKYSVNRDRPFLTYPDIVAKDVESGPSFPSYHTAASFNTATSLSLKYPHWYVIIPSYLWAGSVGYSRMRLGVHYPSDVVAGALMGAGSAWLTHELRIWYQKQQQKHGKIQ
jgi:membrane-associated phospholipid phosphatase